MELFSVEGVVQLGQQFNPRYGASMKTGCISRAFAIVPLLLASLAQAAEPSAVFITQDGQQTPLAVDAQTMKRLREWIPSPETNTAKQVPLRLDCAAIGRLKQDMRNAKPPKMQRSAPAVTQFEAASSEADLKHQHRQTREWLDELDRRFECGPRKSEQR
jgi:hypothetical protein